MSVFSCSDSTVFGSDSTASCSHFSVKIHACGIVETLRTPSAARAESVEGCVLVFFVNFMFISAFLCIKSTSGHYFCLDMKKARVRLLQNFPRRETANNLALVTFGA